MCVTSSSAGARITTRGGHTAHWPTTRLRRSQPGGQRPSAPSETKSGRIGKARNGRFTGVTHLSLWSAKTAGIFGHNRTTQAESSTSTWYTFAGHVKTITVSTYKWWEMRVHATRLTKLLVSETQRKRLKMEI